MRYDVEMVSDLYEAGRTDDGQPFIAERYFAQLEDANGRRWRHRVAANGAINLGHDENGEGPFYGDNRQDAQAKIGKLVARVVAHLAAGGSVDFDHWYEIDPAFGSEEYVGQGIDARDWQRERNEARVSFPW